MIKSLKYIGFYTIPTLKPIRSVSLAARNKMSYTIDVLREYSKEIMIVSPASILKGQKGCFSRISTIATNVKLLSFGVLPSGNKIFNIINRKLINFQLFFYLLFKTKKDEPILVYHSLVTAKIVLLAKSLKRFRLILEMNELYSDVSPKQEKYRQLEYKCIEQADAFIFPNTLMDSMFNSEGKSSIVEHGVYKPNDIIGDKISDGKIHVVYAGTFEVEKGGALAAIHAAEYLPSNYHVHILGFGTDEELQLVNKCIFETSIKTGCTITYDGILDGEDFDVFLQSCHIGLSTQKPGEPYNDTSFPSKILTYLANGMQVVSIDIPAIKKSEVASVLHLYSDTSPANIAKAITDIQNFEPHFDLLNRLDKKLHMDISTLLEKI